VTSPNGPGKASRRRLCRTHVPIIQHIFNTHLCRLDWNPPRSARTDRGHSNSPKVLQECNLAMITLRPTHHVEPPSWELDYKESILLAANAPSHVLQATLTPALAPIQRRKIKLLSKSALSIDNTILLSMWHNFVSLRQTTSTLAELTMVRTASRLAVKLSPQTFQNNIWEGCNDFFR
jgi:hypothetical protein